MLEMLADAPAKLAGSPHAIIRRVCDDCSDAYKDIYYRRILPVTDDVDIWQILGQNFQDQPGNIHARDYAIFSTYSDAINFENGWHCDDAAGDAPAAAPADGWVTYEAEAYTASSPDGVKIEHDEGGNVATYVDIHKGDGSFVEWNNIDGGIGGDCTLRFRYSGGGARPRFLTDLLINGVHIGIVTFQSTNNWSTYTYEEFETTCTEGEMTVRLEFNGHRGPYLDSISVSNEAGGARLLSITTMLQKRQLNSEPKYSFGEPRSITQSTEGYPEAQIDAYPSNYILQFTINPTGISTGIGKAGILQFTTGASNSVYGARNPIIYFEEGTTQLSVGIITEVDGQPGMHRGNKFSLPNDLELNMNHIIELRVIGPTRTILRNGNVENTADLGPRSLLTDPVLLYIGPRHMDPADAIISDLSLTDVSSGPICSELCCYPEGSPNEYMLGICENTACNYEMSDNGSAYCSGNSYTSCVSTCSDDSTSTTDTGTSSSYPNIASLGSASQSSLYDGESLPGNALDGDTSTTAITTLTNGAWWRLDFPDDVSITEIVIYNRISCCQERLSGAKVLILDRNDGIIKQYNIGNSRNIPSFTFTEPSVVTGKAVKVQLSGGGYLQLAEVEVYGYTYSEEEGYKIVESGNCVDHGYQPIYDNDKCVEAASSLGKTITWGPHGGYREVIDGCSLRRSQLFLNPESKCEPDFNRGNWAHTGCLCMEKQPCLCEFVRDQNLRQEPSENSNEVEEGAMGFPGRCRPHINDPVDSYKLQQTHQKDNLVRSDDGEGARHYTFYIEAEAVFETSEWMSEDDEMNAYFNPSASLEYSVEKVCEESAISVDTDSHYGGVFPEGLQPYVNKGRSDQYAGWYDIQGCGTCNDWCGWFSTDDNFDGGMNPLYQSWTHGNNMFACISGLPSDVRTSAIDITPFYASFIPYQLNAEDSDFVSYLEFFPTINRCSSAYTNSPSKPSYKYLGCYKDTSGDRALPYSAGIHSFDSCYSTCALLGWEQFGRQYDGECWCGGTNNLSAQSSTSTDYMKHGPSATNVGSGEQSQSGIEHNVLDSEITEKGWTKCYTGTYTVEDNTSLSDIMNNCQGTNIMYGCRATSSPDWKLIGYGNRDKAFTTSDSDGIVDGAVKWYFSEDLGGMGFADSNDDLDLRPCDRMELESNNRLCWHVSTDSLNDGWRCGEESWLNSDITWERSIWTTNTAASSMTYSEPQCGDCEGNSIGSLLNCVFQYVSPTTQESSECVNLDVFDIPNTQNEFPPNLIPYIYQVPIVDDPYAGYYDVQRCGKCNDYCFWAGPSKDGSGLNPRWNPRTSTDYFTCKLAGGSNSLYGMTEREHFGSSFPYAKCEGEGAGTPAVRNEKFVGCFHDKVDDRSLSLQIGQHALDLEECANSCRDKGYHYFGRQDQGYCYCGGEYASDHSYAKHGTINPESSEYCSSCDGNNVGMLKQCVFQIIDQYDPAVERKKNECSHISVVDVRRHCYVSCRDSHKDYVNLLACQTLKVLGLTTLNNEIAVWRDSPVCDTKDCRKDMHPLGNDLQQSVGTH